jgi:hypothetical protein
MTYNPIFEEELERDKELKGLREQIRYRATMDQLKDLSSKTFKFVKRHPIVTILALGVFGLGARN